ncbi:MAG: DUF6932 family protein [Syntrophobacteraceae bacterium]
MIPEPNQSGVLPPFHPGSTPASRGAMAPYRVALIDVAQRFGNNETRKKILTGLVSYRSLLRKEGISSGFQWVDGSFVEQSERVLGRPPGDVDIITFAARPERYRDPAAWREFILSRPDIFNPIQIKTQYLCDAYFVDLSTNPIFLVNQTKYWFGLFSHQRETFLWKGMLEVPIDEDDADVSAFLLKGGGDAA